MASKNDLKYLKSIISEALNSTSTQVDTQKGMEISNNMIRIFYPKMEANVFMKEDGSKTILPKLSMIQNVDAEKIQQAGIGNVGHDDSGIRKMKNGRFVTYGNGKSDKVNTYKKTCILFPKFKIESKEKENDTIKSWLQTKMLQNSINILVNSETAQYRFGEDGEGTVLTNDTKLDFFRLLVTQFISSVRDNAPFEDVDVSEKDLEQLQNEIYQAYMNGDFKTAIKNLGYVLNAVDRKYGLQLSDRQVKQIIAKAISSGLNPGSPNWPTFVRSRSAWKKLGFYVCDDPGVEYDKNGNPTGISVREPVVIYPFDAYMNNRVSKKDIERGVQMIGHTKNDIYTQSGNLSQIGDLGRMKGAPYTQKGIHGVGYDISDVVPIPGTMTWAIWKAAPGLKNNLKGELNDVALALETQKQSEFDAKKKSLEQQAENDPEAAQKIKDANAENETAKILNEAIQLMISETNGDEKGIKLSNTGNDVKDYVLNIQAWATIKSKKFNITARNINSIIDATVSCIIYQTVGTAYLPETMKEKDDKKTREIFSGDRGKQDFKDMVMASQEDILSKLVNYSRQIIAMRGRDEEETEQEVSTVNEAVENNELGIKRMSMDELMDTLGINTVENESKELGNYWSLLNRIENL